MKRLLFLTLTCALVGTPAFADFRLAVDLSDRELEAVVDGRTVESFSIAVGTDRYPTPRGQFKIRKLIWNPSWKPPDSKWARKKSPTPPGHPDNPMKVVKIFFEEPDYYIHGTDDRDSLGAAESHGCIRMSPADVSRLGLLVMEHGGKSMTEPWYRRIFRRKTTKVVYLSVPVAIVIKG